MSLMSSLQAFFQIIFDLNNIWWLVIKTILWFIVALIIIIKTDSPKPETAFRDLKSTLGFFLMFLLVSTGLIYLLFGQIPA